MSLVAGIKFVNAGIRLGRFLLKVICLSLILHFVAKGQLAGQTGSEWITAFYKARGNKLFWFDDSLSIILRQQLLTQLERSGEQGLRPDQYSLALLRRYLNSGPSTIKTADHLYTQAAMAYWMDVLRGGADNSVTGKDILSEQQIRADYKKVLDLLARSESGAAFDSIAKTLEPATQEYYILKAALKSWHGARSGDTAALLATALNANRWIHHFHYPKCIVVNIASGLLRYYEKDSLKLEMKVVTGMPATPTPRFTAYCNEVILYPYWNVPRSIAVNELLPLCKRSPAVLSFLNMQVLDDKGNALDPEKIVWQRYNKKNFPYRFRQATGCDNALGVIKFNLVSPYGVYLHDTNNKLSFTVTKRFFSHGCIRLEKPVELANFLLGKELDSKFLNACLKKEQPRILPLPLQVPVFVVYLRAEVNPGAGIVYYEDVYKLKSESE